MTTNHVSVASDGESLWLIMRRKDYIYQLNAHERHHKVVNMNGKLGIFFKPRRLRVGACLRDVTE